MLRIIISGNYYDSDKKSGIGKLKKDYVYFYDYDDCVGFILDQMTDSEIYKLKVNLYNKYYKLIKFTKFGEKDINGKVFTGYKLLSPIIGVTYDDFARLLPSNSFRKVYFVRDDVKERFNLKSDFINYVKLNV